MRLEVLIARLVAQLPSGQIGYWAAFRDAGGTSHFAFVVDPTYAPLAAENAARRASAVVAFERALERYRATLAGLRSARYVPRPGAEQRGNSCTRLAMRAPQPMTGGLTAGTLRE